ncbi:unnamed protein product [Parajaminaea phylloscopi]
MLASRVRCARALRPTRVSLALHHGTRTRASAGAEEHLNALQVTDPLTIYQGKVARGELEEDQEQVKALVKLRSLTRRLQDYTPPAHLLGILGSSPSVGVTSQHSSREAQNSQAEKQQKELVRYLTTQETLADLDTPRGLLLTGPPGTGKSMVLDIWFDSLPNHGKFRRHYHHLLLTIYRIIWVEAEKRRQALRGGAPPQPLATSEKDLEWGQHASSGPRRPTVSPARGTGVIWKRGGEHGIRPDGKGSGWRRVLQGMPFFRADSMSDFDGKGDWSHSERHDLQASADMATAGNGSLPLHAAAQLFLRYGPVMLFDEIQLVDIASAGLLKRTLEAYWLLGGVVVGSSNRLPEDLYNYGVQQNQLVQFFQSLQDRCPVHEMKGERDFRRVPGVSEFLERLGTDDTGGAAQSSEARDVRSNTTPNTYFVKGQETQFYERMSFLVAERTPVPTTLKVYNREVKIPEAYPPSDMHAGLASFTFAQLCDSPLGPADYLTIVSHFEEIVIKDVPQLLLVNKNQARRFITFIDAAYESGTRLHILADSGPDELFFPEARGERRRPRDTVSHSAARSPEPDDVVDMSARGAKSPFLTPPAGEVYPEEKDLASRHSPPGATRADRESNDAYELTSEELIQSEVLSEARQDVEEGFRPHVSSFQSGRTSSTPSSWDVADQLDARRAEIEAKRIAREQARLKEEAVVGFPDLAIFSGADERFSYARAVSRLHEMSHPVWRRRKAWTPLLESEMMLWGVGNKGNSAGGTTASSTNDSTISSYPDRPHTGETMDFADEASYETSTFPDRTSAYADDPSRPHDSSSSLSHWLQKGGPVAQSMPRAPREQDEGPPSSSTVANRDGPPRISPVHVWGQADWGPGAGKWGLGPKAYAADSARAQGRGRPSEEGSVATEEPVDEAEESPRDRRARLKQVRLTNASNSSSKD